MPPRLSGLGAILLVLAACGEARPAAPARSSAIRHVVLLKLEDPSRVDELLKDARAMVAAVPGIAAAHVGRPLDLGRPEVAGDYDVGLVLSFEDAAAYRAFLEHPRHVEVARTWKPLLRSTRVHDVTDAAP